MSTRFKVLPFAPKPLTWWKANWNKVDWNPPYQRRGRLWSSNDKAYLIDSILNDYDIPKIYVADFTWGESQLNLSSLPYAIIDGKQRFEAIHDFFYNKIVLNDDFVFSDEPSLKLNGLAYKDLQKHFPEAAEKFETSSLTVMSVFAESEERINDLFIRLNRSKPLTGAEIRNAMNGPAPEVFRSIAGHDFFTENIRFTTARGADWNAAAKLVLFEFHGEPHETKKKSLDKFVRETQSQPEKLELASRRVLEVLDRMCEIFLPKDTLLGSAGIVPVYYWFIREVDPDWYSMLRPFLVDFEHHRKENRGRAQKAGETSSKIDKVLLEYDRFNRSTNDQQSHVGRHAILMDRFESWDG